MWQGPSTGRVGTPSWSGTPLGLEMPPREELSARGNLPQRRKYYPSQSAKTMLKHFFDLNIPTVLDPGHTTTSLSADQMIQFTRAVGLKVTLASYGLLEVLVPCAREQVLLNCVVPAEGLLIQM